MTLRFLPHLCRAFTAGAIVLTLASCGSTNPAGPGGQITKVKYYRLDSKKPPIPGAEPPINFEREYHLHGAVSNKERSARDGHYYSVMWKVTDRSQPVKVRLEYRQQNSGMTVKTLEQEVAKIGRSNVTRFEVNGEQFVTGGLVTSWHVSLVRGKQVLAEASSYLWK